MELKVEKLTSTAKIPTRGNPSDAGLDVFSDEDMIIPAQAKANIKTGIRIAIPQNCVGLIWDKGGMANNGIHTIAGVIDAGYRGEVIILLYNLNNENYQIKQGQKIAQLIIQKFEAPEISEEKIDTNTERGEGRFGSTGKF